MSIFILIFITVFLISVIRTGGRILCNEIFWLILFWCFIIGVFFFGGVKYGTYGTSIVLYLFLFICTVAFILGRNKGYNSVKKADNSPVIEIHTTRLTILGIIGLLLYVFDVFRLNGLLFLFEDSSTKATFKTSFWGGVGSIFIPILLVQGVYLFTKDLAYKNRINVYAIFLLLLYTLPCVFHTGREAILYIIIAITAAYGYKQIVGFKNKKHKLRKVIIVFVSILAIAFLFRIIIDISKDRFGLNEIRTFLYKHDVDSKAMVEASRWGDFEFFYYNVLSYFSHQIPFLDFTLQNYDGPYMFGLFELNIITRRLPDFLGIDYNKVFEKFGYLYRTKGITFSGGWNTVLGSLICEVGWIGTIILCFIIGIFTGKIRKKFDLTHNIRYAVIVIIFCVSSFATIQLGPFYNILIYGSYIWWYVLYGHGKLNIKK